MLPPRPLKPPALPQYVGEGDSRVDVAKLTDRGVAVKALDTVLRLKHAMETHASEFLSFRKDATDDKATLLKLTAEHERRLSALEGRPREVAHSSHEWDDLLLQAGAELSKRVKDGRDQLDSDRARQIALEVVNTVKVADDANAFRTWRTRGGKIALEVIKLLVTLAIGAAAAHYGLHGGQ